MASPQPGIILVVDDHEMNRDLLSRYLKREGHTVVTAENGRQALALLIMRKFDLVLLDIMMPELSGFEVLQRMRDDDELKGLPVVVISALEDTESIAHSIELGAEDYLAKPINPILLKARVNASLEKKRLRDMERETLQRVTDEKKRADELLELIIPLGVALSAEKDFDRLLEMILFDAKTISNADGGTLYLRTQDDRLRFEIMRNDTLGIALGGSTGKKIPFAPLSMYDLATGQPNHHNVATYAAVTAASVNVTDAYETEGFDFSGTRAFDKANSYQSTSFLTIPLKNHAGHVIGVLQLINAKDKATSNVIPFDRTLQKMVESLSSLATVTLEAYIREQTLKQQIQELRIVIDESKKQSQVAEITESEYFQSLREKVATLRRR
ncbi:MAG TPA: response regulator [Anaerolineales bacterium]|nr:response regulator [Anaerolineales bacterium]